MAKNLVTSWYETPLLFVLVIYNGWEDHKTYTHRDPGYTLYIL